MMTCDQPPEPLIWRLRGSKSDALSLCMVFNCAWPLQGQGVVTHIMLVETRIKILINENLP